MKKDKKYGLSEIDAHYSPKIKLALEGIRCYIVPRNFLARLLWRYLSIEIKFKETPSLYSLLPKREWKKTGEYRVKSEEKFDRELSLKEFKKAHKRARKAFDF